MRVKFWLDRALSSNASVWWIQIRTPGRSRQTILAVAKSESVNGLFSRWS